MDIQTIGSVALVTYAVSIVALVLFIKRRKLDFVFEVWKRFTMSMVFETTGILLVTVGLVYILLYVPGLNYGWLHLFFEKGSNISLAPFSLGMESNSEWVKFASVLFLAALVLAVPFFAKSEEEMFRKGNLAWKAITWQSIKFGLIHCLVGIPLAAGIALIVPGLFYGYHYKKTFEDCIRKRRTRSVAGKEALMVSTVYHSLHNTILMCFLSYVLLSKALGY